MHILFETKYTFLFIVVCLLISLTISMLIYYKNKDSLNLNKFQKVFLFSLRFVFIFFISILILSPLARTNKKQIENPIITIAIDNSSSLLNQTDSASGIQFIQDIYNKLYDGLKSDFEIASYSFGEETQPFQTLSLNEKRSDYSEMINTIYSGYLNKNVGSLIVIGDGIYNKGKNPISDIQKLNYPVYSIGIGDTSITKDARISDIRVNKNTFIGNRFPVEIDLQFSEMDQISELQIFRDEKMVFSEQIIPSGDQYFTTVQTSFQSDSVGLQHYYLSLETNENESNEFNNNSQFVINVLETKQKILILSDGSHPDIGAIKNSLEIQENYDVSIFTESPYPENFKDFNLIILNQLPTSRSGNNELVSKAIESNIPLFFIVGSKTFIPQLNQFNLGIDIDLLAGNYEEATPVLNTSYQIFEISDRLIENINNYPPLLTPFANFNLQSFFSILCYQDINNIETSKPLIVTGINNRQKIGFILGEGIWKWRLYNYYFNESHDTFNELVNLLIQYLALSENEDNFIIEFESVYNETDPVILKAEVYNELFQAINHPEVSIILNNNGNEYYFTFDRSGDYYRLDAGSLPVGDYTFQATVKIDEQEYQETGSFTIIPVNIEMAESKANHQILYQMAFETGGNLYSPEQTEELINDIIVNNSIKPVTYIQSSLTDILNLKWIFFVLVVVAALEWFLRKFWGIY